jgi:site-specific recombinase XerD
MKLSEAIATYVDHKRSLGMKFTAEGFVLRAFCAALGDVAMSQVRAGPVEAFLAGPDHSLVTATWTKKYSVLTGLYRFALARQYVKASPLPSRAPKLTEPAFIPYIYSQQELKRMLDAVPAACSSNTVAVEAGTYGTLLLLLYGAGLRLGEALSLTVADVDLDQAILCVRGTKFYKTRLVPLCMDLTFALARYVLTTRRAGHVDSA